MFRCNLPPALLADWQGSFTCRLAGVFYLQTGRGLLPADWQRSFTCRLAEVFYLLQQSHGEGGGRGEQIPKSVRTES